jgi:hypothetical protein
LLVSDQPKKLENRSSQRQWEKKETNPQNSSQREEDIAMRNVQRIREKGNQHVLAAYVIPDPGTRLKLPLMILGLGPTCHRQDNRLPGRLWSPVFFK